MVRIWLVLLFSLFFFKSNASSAKFANICKVWGFLKYYDPYVSQGKIDWDSCLIFLLRNEIQKNESSEAFVKIIKMISNKNKAFKRTYEKSNQNFNFYELKDSSISWITDTTILGRFASQYFLFIENKFKRKSNYYVSCPSNYWYDYFCNEKQYPFFKLDIPPIEYRLLGLFRLWNVIEYYYPFYNKYQNEWRQSLESCILGMIESKNFKDYYKVYQKLLSKLHDGHALVSTTRIREAIGYFHFPFELKSLDGKFFIVKKINEIENIVQCGDQLLKINGTSLHEIIDSISMYHQASSQKSFELWLSSFLGNSFDSFTNIQISRNGMIHDIRIHNISIDSFYLNYEKPSLPEVRSFSGDILYLNLKYISKKTIDSVFSKTSPTSKVILDLRNHPDGDMSITKLMSYLTQSLGPTHIEVEPDIKHPKKFISTPINKRLLSKRIKPIKKVFILIDESANSRGDFYALMLKDISGAVFIGSPTAGNIGVRNNISVPGVLYMNFTISDERYINNQSVRGEGVKPDIYFYPTIEGICNETDELLEFVIKKANE